jgi:hypothetical protein
MVWNVYRQLGDFQRDAKKRARWCPQTESRDIILKVR